MSPEAKAAGDNPELRDHKEEYFLEFPLYYPRLPLLAVSVPAGLTFKETYLSQLAVGSMRCK